MYEALVCAKLFAEHWKFREQVGRGMEIWKPMIMTQNNQCCDGGHPGGRPLSLGCQGTLPGEGDLESWHCGPTYQVPAVIALACCGLVLV